MYYSDEANQIHAPFILPDLPYSKESFEPHFTAETFDYHHGKHHQAYVTNLNKLLETNKELKDKSLEDIIILSNTDKFLKSIFNNAAQIWNHTFFWHSMTPNPSSKPSGKLLEHINKDFGSLENLITEFKSAATSQFGSGWAWLVCHEDKLQIVKTSNAETPITQGMQPLLACDVWEHAYYIDYRNKRPDYVNTYMEHLINWDFAKTNFDKIVF